MRARETGLVAAREVREAIRGRWFAAAALAFLVLSLGLSAVGLAGAERTGLAGFDRTSVSLLNLVLLFVPLLTLVLGSLGLAGELEDGSLAMVLALPLTRAEVFAGKYLGLSFALGCAILGGFGATGAIVGIATGGNARAFVSLVALTWLLAAATLGFGVAASALLRSRVRAVGAGFGLWLFFVYLSDLGTIGLTIARDLGPGKVFALALLNPVQCARVIGTLALTDRTDVLGPVGLYGVDTFGETGLLLLLAGALAVFAAAPLGVAWHSFRNEVI